MKYCIVASEFNDQIVKPMVADCVRGFEEQGIKATVVWVPGAVEIPLMAQLLIETGAPDAVVALGCVIRGETDHYGAVCSMVERGLMDVMLKTKVPVIFEVLMVDDEKKALERISKGYHAAYSATKMAALTRGKNK